MIQTDERSHGSDVAKMLITSHLIQTWIRQRKYHQKSIRLSLESAISVMCFVNFVFIKWFRLTYTSQKTQHVPQIHRQPGSYTGVTLGGNEGMIYKIAERALSPRRAESVFLHSGSGGKMECHWVTVCLSGPLCFHSIVYHAEIMRQRMNVQGVQRS